MQIHLKRGERIYINGAVLKMEQRCSIEILNNVSFLLENHVMQPEKATTPLRQLYFTVQTMLIDPENALMTRELYWHQSAQLFAMLDCTELKESLVAADASVKNQRYFEALKIIRSQFEREDILLQPVPQQISA